MAKLAEQLYVRALAAAARRDGHPGPPRAAAGRWPSSTQPPRDWIHRAQLSEMHVDGYGVLRDDGSLRTRPCYPANLVFDNCTDVGLVLTIAPSRNMARSAARRELSREKARHRIAGDRRWLCPVRAEMRGFDLRECLAPAEAEFVRREIVNGRGDELAWTLAKTPGCEGLFIPTNPPTLFVFERCVAETVQFGRRHRPAVLCPSDRPQNILDFAVCIVLGFVQPPTDP